MKGDSGQVLDSNCSDTQCARIDLGEIICVAVDGRNLWRRATCPQVVHFARTPARLGFRRR